MVILEESSGDPAIFHANHAAVEFLMIIRPISGDGVAANPSPGHVKADLPVCWRTESQMRE